MSKPNSTQLGRPTEPTDRSPPQQPLYETATIESLDPLSHYSKTVIKAATRELDTDHEWTAARIADLVTNDRGPEALVVYPDGTRILLGRDETSHDSGLFVFVPDGDGHGRKDGLPPVRTVEEALELLKPGPVVAAEARADVTVYRQGEWWFVETDRTPAFSVPGHLGSKPYGPSPMDNHVAREYGFGLPKSDLLSELSLYVSDGACEQIFGAVPECFDAIRSESLVRGRNWSGRFHDIDWTGIPNACDGVFVRGSVRHRRNEHRMLHLGQGWHRAYTHGETVYQPVPTTYGNDSVDKRHGSRLRVDHRRLGYFY